ncbi:MAG: hypothetical protein JSV49_05920 [Thermoplasmata archaeon]|nr:MAG: hypothetical protein JSV49_05920 [Thermoplasmata archaeon]
MIKKDIRIVIIISMLFFIISPNIYFNDSSADASETRADVSYDKFMIDPFDDVKKIGANDILTSAEGFENIDLIKAVSYQPLNEFGLVSQLEVTFELTVNGIITDHKDIIYIVLISSDDDDYIITYNNGNSEGISSDNPFGPSFNVDSEGAGTDTLNLTVNLVNIGPPHDYFDWTALGMMTDSSMDGGDYQYMDKAPDKIIKFTEPTHLGTVHSTVTVEGLVEPSIVTIQSVEYQIDTKFDGNWNDVDDNNGDYSEWSFSWDTTAVQDEVPHDINVRGYDGERYYEDTITLYVVQANKDNPEQIKSVPEINAGDTFEFSSTHDPSYMGIKLEMITDLTETVVSAETYNVGGTSYEVWRRELTGDGVATYANIPIDFTMDGYSLTTRDELNVVKEMEEMMITVPLVGTIEAATTITYTPPLNSFDFPLVIGERWNTINDISTFTEMRYSGDYANDTSEGEVEYLFEALHTETTVVPKGEFDTFVIRSQQKDSDMYELSYFSPELGNIVRAEGYDNNNELLQRIDLTDYSLGTGIFLEIIDVTIEPAKPKAKEKAKITVNVKNTGTVNAAASPLTLNVNGEKKYEMLVDLPSQQSTQVIFYWEPEKEGEYDLEIISPDDSWDDEIRVYEADETGTISDLVSNPTSLILILLIIILIFIIIVKIFMKRKKKMETVTEQQGELSAFDKMKVGQVQLGPKGEVPISPSMQPSAGEVGGPRIISVKTGLSQVGAAPGDRAGLISCPTCAHKFKIPDRVASAMGKKQQLQLSCPKCKTKINRG